MCNDRYGARRSEYELRFHLLFAKISAEYPDGSYAEPGKPLRLKLGVRDPIMEPGLVRMRWLLPEGWSCADREMRIGIRAFCHAELETTVTPPETPLPAMSYLHLEVMPAERRCPTVVTIPVRSRTAVSFPLPENSGGDWYTLRAGNLRAIKSCQKD